LRGARCRGDRHPARQGRSRLSRAGTSIPQVLTAAHVADEAGDDGYVGAGDKKYPIHRIIWHPDWHGVADVKFDIGLVALDEPVTGIGPAKLYTGSDEVGMTVTFVGRAVITRA
jgi:hypothetical protein